MANLFSFLGIDDGSQRFDLPFHARLGTEFLIFLTGLMTVLCLLAVTASLSLSQLANKWTAGLETTLTVEIPYSDTQGTIANNILSELQETDGIKSAKLLGQEDMNKLLSPWLGSAAEDMKNLPMPVLITIELKERDQKLIRGVAQLVRGISSDIRVDAHEQWLTDLVRFTRALNIAAFLIMIAIGLVTSLTVGGAVRSRMAIHHTELELLHIMGSSDSYITGQFQRYICLLAGKGVLIGFIISAALVGLLHVLSLTSQGTLPGLKLNIWQFMALPVAAGLLLIICGWTARMTALKVLRDMP